MSVQDLWTIRLPMIRPLTLNARQHWAVKHREVAKLRGDTLLVARSARIPAHERIEVQLIYFPRDRRRRDADNLVATLKVACDALIDAGVVVDDDPAHMVKHMPHIAAPDGDPRLVLHIIGLVPAANPLHRSPMIAGKVGARRRPRVVQKIHH